MTDYLYLFEDPVFVIYPMSVNHPILAVDPILRQGHHIPD